MKKIYFDWNYFGTKEAKERIIWIEFYHVPGKFHSSNKRKRKKKDVWRPSVTGKRDWSLPFLCKNPPVEYNL